MSVKRYVREYIVVYYVYYVNKVIYNCMHRVCINNRKSQCVTTGYRFKSSVIFLSL